MPAIWSRGCAGQGQRAAPVRGVVLDTLSVRHLSGWWLVTAELPRVSHTSASSMCDPSAHVPHQYAPSHLSLMRTASHSPLTAQHMPSMRPCNCSDISGAWSDSHTGGKLPVRSHMLGLSAAHVTACVRMCAPTSHPRQQCAPISQLRAKPNFRAKIQPRPIRPSSASRTHLHHRNRA